MSSFHSGTFDRSQLKKPLQRFAPVEARHSLHEISLDALAAAGKRLILLDVDNTLVQWKGEEPSPEILAWLSDAKAQGFQLCLISNTRRPARLMRLSEKLEIPVVRGRMKPSRAMYRLALATFRVPADQAVMVGDQLVTDVFGANRSGIDAIWVERMEGKEFRGTAVNRMIEAFLKTRIYRALALPQKSGTPEQKQQTLFQQLVRFLVVGGTSFVIDSVIKAIILNHSPIGASIGAALRGTVMESMMRSQDPILLASPIAAFIAWSIATINSLIFNRSWTFEAVGKERRSVQIRKFYTVTIIAAILNIGLFTLFFNLIPGKRVFVSNVLAAGIVAVWNFLGQRLYAFKAREE